MGPAGARELSATRLVAAALCLAASPAPLSAQTTDPFEARIIREDAERFAELFARTGGRPTAQQLQEGYLDPGTRAIAVFTPGRIESAAHLAASIEAQAQDYRRAIASCLQWSARMDGELRATYFAIRGLLPEKPLPQIALVFGAGNSGGTAAPGMQVLGLEVLCRGDPTFAEFSALMRQFFAHETVHSLQDYDSALWDGEAFLTATLSEGSADYIAALVTGRPVGEARDKWASAREDEVFGWFARDLAIYRDEARGEAEREAAFHNWFANAGNPPEGLPEGAPGELGYWVGMRIAEGFVTSARDPNAAIRQLLAFDDPHAILVESGLAGRVLPPSLP